MIHSRLGLAAAVALLVAVCSPPAHATSPVASKGAPGAVDLFVVQGWWTDHGSTLRVNGPDVRRSNGGQRRWRIARGIQRICVSYDVYKFEGAYYEVPWGHHTGDRRCDSVRPSYQLDFTDFTVGVTGYNSYNVEVTVSWRRARDGRFIGSRRWDYSSPADYRCMTHKCDTYSGYNGVAAIFFEGSI
jgi:hypothetical protein